MKQILIFLVGITFLLAMISLIIKANYHIKAYHTNKNKKILKFAVPGFNITEIKELFLFLPLPYLYNYSKSDIFLKYKLLGNNFNKYFYYLMLINILSSIIFVKYLKYCGHIH
jgi:hypothetical protein